jgi:hypothetical protein
MVSRCRALVALESKHVSIRSVGGRRRSEQTAEERLGRATSQVPKTFGGLVRKIDTAWPGNHIRRMYDDPSKRQASNLAQPRTGTTPLNGIQTTSNQWK